jgi:hypothetical protein
VISNSTDVDELIEDTTGLRSEYEVRYHINRHHDLIGEGSEAKVYELNNRTVIKVADSEKTRGEYVIFADPQYRDVTPNVRGHHPKWYWIAVERVDPLEHGDWDRIFDHLSSFYDVYRDYDELKHPAAIFDQVLLDLDGQASFSIFDVWPQVREEEREWFHQVVEMYHDLGLNVRDVRPENLGVTDGGDLVIVDIRVEPW